MPCGFAMCCDPADILLFADVYGRRYGTAAVLMARVWADRLRNVGDDEGYRVWVRIAQQIAENDHGVRASSRDAA